MTRPGTPTVLVTDAGRGSAIAILRTVRARGWRAIAADHDPASPGFRSRAVSARVRYPDPVAHPEQVADVLARAVRRHGVDLVIPVTDELILPLDAVRSTFPARLALPAHDALRTTQDKAATFDLARRLDVPVPYMAVVTGTEAAVAAWQGRRWPVVVKPARSRVVDSSGIVRRLEVRYASDEAALRATMADLGNDVRAILQEWVPGHGVGIELLLDRGRPILAFAHRRLHEVPITGGASALRESTPLDPTLYAEAVRLMGAMDWTGLAMVEFRVGPTKHALMEVNGRVWGSLPLAVAAGVDFPGRLVDISLGLPVPAPEEPCDGASRYRIGLRGRDLEKELTWIGAVLAGARRRGPVPVPPRRAALGAIAGLADPRVADDVFRWTDPGPSAAQVVRFARRAAWRLMVAVRPGGPARTAR